MTAHRFRGEAPAGAAAPHLLLIYMPPPAGRRVPRACAVRGAALSAPPGRSPPRALLALSGALALPATAQTVVLVSNFGGTVSNSNAAIGTYQYAKCFGTGKNSGGYNLTSLELDVKVVPASTANLTVAIYSTTTDASNSVVPDAEVVALTIPTLSVGTNTFTAPANTVLDPSTEDASKSYCVFIVDSTSTGTTLELGRSSSSSADMTATGWGLDNGYRRRGTDPWVWSSFPHSLRVRLNGSAVGGVTPSLSTDATLSGGTVKAGSTTLVTFASGTTSYTASVANGVDEVTFAPTTNHASATVRYLKGTDVLTDVDSTDDGHQVTLDVGTNAITVEVTAEDGTTTQTYTVTVTRAAAMTPTCTLNTGDVWCGTVTVGTETDSGGATTDHGFSSVTGNSFGALTDNSGDQTFTYGSETYAVSRVSIVAAGFFAGELHFRVQRESLNDFVLADAHRAKLALHVDGSSKAFAFRDRTGLSANFGYTWRNSGLDWSSATTVTVRLRELPDAPTGLEAGVGNAQVGLTWDTPASGANITRHEYRFKTGNGSYPTTWTQIATSAPGGTNQASYTVTGLTNEIAHTFELRAVNDSGGSAADEDGPVTPTPGICDRTQQVRESIIYYLEDAHSLVRACAEVTVADLARLTYLEAGNQSIGSLQSGDFSGLTSVEDLELNGNTFTTLPANLFSGMTSLENLRLNDGKLSSIDAGAFSGLASLQLLDLTANDLTSLPGTVFSGLTALVDLDLEANDLVSLPGTVFSGLTALVDLDLHNNDLTSLPDGLFTGPTALRSIDLHNNDLTSLLAGVFSGLTALTSLSLDDNDLTSLPAGVFSGLTALFTIQLQDNDLTATSLPAGVFAGLTMLRRLNLDDNPDTGDTLPLTVTVEKVGTDQARAEVAAGAPFAVDFTPVVANGALPASDTKLAVAQGSVEGMPVTVTRTSGTTEPVTVDIDLSTQPTLPGNHSGYEFARAASGLPKTILSATTNNDPVFASTTATREVPENSAVGTNVGAVIPAATDADTGDTPTYSMGGADAASFAFDASTRQITTIANVDYNHEAMKNSYSVTVTASDGNGGVATVAVTIDVTDVAEQPAKPEPPTVTATARAAGSLDVDWVKPDLNGGPDITGYEVKYQRRASGSWSLQEDWPHSGTGTTTTITGLEPDSDHRVQVLAKNGETDSAFSDYSAVVKTNAAPTIVNRRVAVTSTPVLATDTYGAGERIEVSVPFSEAVDATPATDFQMSVGGNKLVPLVSGSGTTTLVFGYTVAPGDEDLDGIFIGAEQVTLVGDRNGNPQTGEITSVATGVPANIDHAGPGTQSGHKVDGTRSIVTVEVTSTPQLETDTYGAGETILFTVTFTAAVDVTGDPVLELLFDGSEVRQAGLVSGGGTTALVFGYTVLSTDSDANGLFLRDESDYNNPDGPVRLDTGDTIRFEGTSTDVPLYWQGRGTQSGHKVDGSRTPSNNDPVFADDLVAITLPENSAVGTSVGAAVTATDADDDTLTYSLEGTDAVSFDIDSGTGQIKTKSGVTYDFEATQNTYEMTVTAADGNGGTDTIDVNIALLDADEQSAKPAKPTLAAVSGSSTTLTATWEKPDLNGGPDITGYVLQYREGATGAWEDFAHTGTAVTATIGALTADTEYQVQVRAKNGEIDSDWSDPSDAVRTNAEETSDAPTITAVTVTSTPRLETDTYGAGETIEVSVTFSEAVERHVRHGLRAVRGGRQARAAGERLGHGDAGVRLHRGARRRGRRRRLDRGPGPGPWWATATGSPRTARSRAWPTARRRTSTIRSSGTQSGHKVDGARSIRSVAVTSTPVVETDTYGEGETIRFTVTFNLAVNVTGDPVLTFALGNSGQSRDVDAAYESGSGAAALVFGYTVEPGDVDDNGVFLRDEEDFDNPDGPVRLDTGDSITFAGTSTDVPLYWQGRRSNQPGHKVNGLLSVDNNPPVFTEGETTTRTVAESSLPDIGSGGSGVDVGAPVVATDADNDDLTYTLKGADRYSFLFVEATGQIRTVPPAATIYATYFDEDAYQVEVEARDGRGGAATINVTINVTDTDDGPPEDEEEDDGPPEDEEEDDGPPEDEEEDDGPPEDEEEDDGPPEDEEDDDGPPEDEEDDAPAPHTAAPARLRIRALDANADSLSLHMSWQAPNANAADVTGYRFRIFEGPATRRVWPPVVDWTPVPEPLYERNGRYEHTVRLGLESAYTVWLRAALTNDGVSDHAQADVYHLHTVAVESEEPPDRVALIGNYPNPFNPSTGIVYELPEPGPVRLAVYDMIGREVRVLVDAHRTAGRHTVRFDAEGLPTGTYACVLTAGSVAITRVMVLVR